MGYDLIGRGDTISIPIWLWPDLLSVAESAGWVPKGTELGSGYYDYSAEDKAKWSGDYLSNDGQVIQADDAAAIAEALERLLPLLAAHDPDPAIKEAMAQSPMGQLAQRIQATVREEMDRLRNERSIPQERHPMSGATELMATIPVADVVCDGLEHDVQPIRMKIEDVKDVLRQEPSLTIAELFGIELPEFGDTAEADNPLGRLEHYLQSGLVELENIEELIRLLRSGKVTIM